MPRRPAPTPSTSGGAASVLIRLSNAADSRNLSLDGMREDCLRLCEREGLAVAAVHVDDGLSGAIRDRPGFLAWLDDARSGRASTLVAWHVDRMTREGVNVAALILDVVEGKDPETGRVVRPPVRLIDFHGLDSAGDETAFRLRFVIAAEVARAERERMRARSRAMHRRAREAGRWASGPPPFGFRTVDAPDGAGRVLEAHPEEAAALRRAAERLASGMTLTEACRRLNAEGPAPRRAASWSRVTLRQSLTSESASRFLFGPAERAMLRRALEPKTRDPRKGTRRNARLLSGLLVCSSCGSLLQVARRGDEPPIYRCQARAEGHECERPVAVSAPRIEEVVEALWLDGWGALPETVAVRESDELADRIATLDEEISDGWERMGGLRGSERADLLAEVEAKEAERDALAQTSASTLIVVRETGRSYADAWRSGTPDDRRVLLRRTVETLTLGPGRRGPRGFDPERLVDSWRLDPAASDALTA